MSKLKINFHDIDVIYDIGDGEHIIAYGFDFKREDVEIV